MANADGVTQRAVHDAARAVSRSRGCVHPIRSEESAHAGQRPPRIAGIRCPPRCFGRSRRPTVRIRGQRAGSTPACCESGRSRVRREAHLPSDDVEVAENPGALRAVRGPWRPRFRGGPHPQVQLGREPVDLGGIGKGLGVRWAHDRLEADVDEFLIDAGGDIACRGGGPDGQGWLVAVENPRNGLGPLAVVALRDTACATLSITLRRWRSGGRRVHHLVDPRTGRPGGAGLLAVTVIAPDPADAEVSSKSLFLEGACGISGVARRQTRPPCGSAVMVRWVRHRPSATT